MRLASHQRPVGIWLEGSPSQILGPKDGPVPYDAPQPQEHRHRDSILTGEQQSPRYVFTGPDGESI